jgi:PTS system nitrogen regulatory IIA component
MDIQHVLSPDAVIGRLKTTSKKHALQEMAKVAARKVPLAAWQILDLLLERERLGTTAVGHGVAIPHIKSPDLERVTGVFARLERPVAFDADDGEPVDLIFLLTAPVSAGADHLKALAMVSRTLRDRSLCEKLRGTDNPDALYALLVQSSAAEAAPRGPQPEVVAATGRLGRT